MDAKAPQEYGIIPAKLRYSNDVQLGAKLLYCELTAQQNGGAYVSATNKQLATLMGVTAGTVSRWLSELEQAGFVMLIVDKEDGNLRNIYLANGIRMSNILNAIYRAFS